MGFVLHIAIDYYLHSADNSSQSSRNAHTATLHGRDHSLSILLQMNQFASFCARTLVSRAPHRPRVCDALLSVGEKSALSSERSHPCGLGQGCTRKTPVSVALPFYIAFGSAHRTSAAHVCTTYVSLTPSFKTLRFKTPRSDIDR